MFLIQFDNERAVEEILLRNDWQIVGCPFVVRKWTPGMSYESIQPDSLPMWLWITNLPMEYLHEGAVQYLASSIGDPIRIDKLHSAKGRVRVQVVMSAEQKLPERINILGPHNTKGSCHISYECRVPHYLHCKLFGHWVHECNKISSIKVEREVTKTIFRVKENKLYGGDGEDVDLGQIRVECRVSATDILMELSAKVIEQQKLHSSDEIIGWASLVVESEQKDADKLMVVEPVVDTIRMEEMEELYYPISPVNIETIQKSNLKCLSTKLDACDKIDSSKGMEDSQLFDILVEEASPCTSRSESSGKKDGKKTGKRGRPPKRGGRHKA